MRARRRAVLAGALGLVIGACGAAPPPPTGPVILRPGAPGDANTVPPAGAVVTSPSHTEDDVRFMQMMIPHHQQALEMASLVPDRSSRQEIQLLATRIELSQNDEIRLIRNWLEERGERAAPAMGHGSMPMHGMLSDEEMDRLSAATGDEFDRLFLQFMIRHHQGAVTMVNELFASPGGGQETEVFQFATGVGSDQPIEIARMRRMLAALGR